MDGVSELVRGVDTSLRSAIVVAAESTESSGNNSASASARCSLISCEEVEIEGGATAYSR